MRIFKPAISISHFSQNGNYNKKTMSYLGLFFVIFFWGTGPLVNKFYLKYYSPTLAFAWTSMVSALILAIVFRKKIKHINKDYFRVAIPLGFFYTAAELSQKIGLKFTTPTVYSFLENLSCIVVPFLVWLFAKKKPSVSHILGGFICLASAFVLSGFKSFGEAFSLGIGEILCALAGLLYGVNIAGTGAFTKKFDSALYIMILLAVSSILGFLVSIAFNYITINGVAIETIKFSWNPVLLFSRIGYVMIAVSLCWIIRTNSMKYIDAAVVAVFMPLSAVVTSFLSILFGMDELSSNLIIGAALGVISMIICSFGDILSAKRFLSNQKTVSKNKSL